MSDQIINRIMVAGANQIISRDPSSLVSRKVGLEHYIYSRATFHAADDDINEGWFQGIQEERVILYDWLRRRKRGPGSQAPATISLVGKPRINVKRSAEPAIAGAQSLLVSLYRNCGGNKFPFRHFYWLNVSPGEGALLQNALVENGTLSFSFFFFFLSTLCNRARVMRI